MTNSISSSYSSMRMMQRPDPSQMASKLFSKLDTKNQGYIEKSDLQSAFAQISGSSSSDNSTSVDDVFTQFDSDSDGKITKDEMTSGFTKLAEELDSQFNQMRMNGFGGQGDQGGMQGMGGMPPPPPPQGGQGGDDAGYTKDELSSQLEEIGSSDSKRSSLISSIVNNFDQADTDSDGKVSMQEAMAYDKANSSSSSGSGTSTTASSSSSESSEAKIMHKIMQLMHAYGNSDQISSQQATVAGLVSATA